MGEEREQNPEGPPALPLMRLFVALQPTAAFREALALLQDRLRAAGVTGRYLTPDNLHLTLAFIGMWTEEIPEILPQIQQAFPITLSHLGIFPEARVLWAGVAPSDALDGLAQRVRRLLDEAEIPSDRKAFNPHITLVRKPSVPANVLLSAIEVPPVTMLVRDVCLYRSDHGENGAVYTVIHHSGQT